MSSQFSAEAIGRERPQRSAQETVQQQSAILHGHHNHHRCTGCRPQQDKRRHWPEHRRRHVDGTPSRARPQRHRRRPSTRGAAARSDAVRRRAAAVRPAGRRAVDGQLGQPEAARPRRQQGPQHQCDG